MEKEIVKYRKSEFGNLTQLKANFDTIRVKIVAPIGSTKWLSITEKELKQIEYILTSEI